MLIGASREGSKNSRVKKEDAREEERAKARDVKFHNNKRTSKGRPSRKGNIQRSRHIQPVTAEEGKRQISGED